MTNSIEKLKKVFPEYVDLSKEEAIAFISSFKADKRKRNKWIEKRVKSYEKNYK